MSVWDVRWGVGWGVGLRKQNPEGKKPQRSKEGSGPAASQ